MGVDNLGGEFGAWLGTAHLTTVLKGLGYPGGEISALCDGEVLTGEGKSPTDRGTPLAPPSPVPIEQPLGHVAPPMVCPGALSDDNVK